MYGFKIPDTGKGGFVELQLWGVDGFWASSMEFWLVWSSGILWKLTGGSLPWTVPVQGHVSHKL